MLEYFLSACYYFWRLSKLGRRVYPKKDVESVERGIENSNYEGVRPSRNNTQREVRNTINNNSFENELPQTSHYYPDLSNMSYFLEDQERNRDRYHDANRDRTRDQSRFTPRVVYQSDVNRNRILNDCDNHYDEPNERRDGAFPNAVYVPTEPAPNDPNYMLYYDNYGNKRPIRRRQSSSSYTYEHVHQNIPNPPDTNYRILDRQVTVRYPPDRDNLYNKLERNSRNSSQTTFAKDE